MSEKRGIDVGKLPDELYDKVKQGTYVKVVVDRDSGRLFAVPYDKPEGQSPERLLEKLNGKLDTVDSELSSITSELASLKESRAAAPSKARKALDRMIESSESKLKFHKERKAKMEKKKIELSGRVKK